MNEPHSVILYESPYRVKDTLMAIEKIDKNRRVALGRELTKKFEQVITLPVDRLLQELEISIPLKGEFVIVIDGQYETDEADMWWHQLSINEHVEYYIEKNMSSKEAIKQVAVDRQIQKREVYDSYHINK